MNRCQSTSSATPSPPSPTPPGGRSWAARPRVRRPSTELAEPFPISVQAVSKHLKVLERAGLISARPDRAASALPAASASAPEGGGRVDPAIPSLLGQAASTPGGRLRWVAIKAMTETPKLRTRDPDHPRLDAPREGSGGSGPSPRLRGLVRRPEGSRCRSSRCRWTSGPAVGGGDDVLRAEAPRDPVGGRVPRGGRARAARLHRHRPGRRGGGAGHVDLIDLGRRPDGDAADQQPVAATSEKGYERAGEGWGGFFDRMDQRLAGAG